MGRRMLQWTGDTTYRGADEFLSESITCQPGDKVPVSDEKAAALVKDERTGKLWKDLGSLKADSKPKGGGALSTANTE